MILFSLLAATIALRSYVYLLTQRAQAVLSALQQLRIDQATEEELLHVVPYLERAKNDRNVEASGRRYYWAVITNEPGHFALARLGSDWGPRQWWLLSLAEWLGYRYFDFGAMVIVLDGKVSKVSYGISREAVLPKAAGYMVFVESFHGLWQSHQSGFAVTSADDESPQFRVQDQGRSLRAAFAFDAPPELTAQAFQVKLACFWSWRGCLTPREIAPGLSNAKRDIAARAAARLKSADPCPARIAAGRARYLHDVGIALLEAMQSREVRVYEEGAWIREIVSDFRVVETVRGFAREKKGTMRYRNWIRSPENPRESIPNSGLRWNPAGSRILLFTNHYFESCAVVPAMPSALDAVKGSGTIQRYSEDEIIRGLL